MIADKIEEKIRKILRTTGKKHTSLGIYIDFIGGKKFALTTPHYVNDALEYFGKTIKGNVVNPETSIFLPSPMKQKSLMTKGWSVTIQ